MLSNLLIAGIRTGVAAVVAVLITLLIRLGFTPPAEFEAAITSVLLFLVAIGYNVAVNWLTINVHPIFGYLLGVPKTPTYEEPFTDDDLALEGKSLWAYLGELSEEDAAAFVASRTTS